MKIVRDYSEMDWEKNIVDMVKKGLEEGDFHTYYEDGLFEVCGYGGWGLIEHDDNTWYATENYGERSVEVEVELDGDDLALEEEEYEND